MKCPTCSASDLDIHPVNGSHSAVLWCRLCGSIFDQHGSHASVPAQAKSHALLAAERDKLRAFKDWVHQYLDAHGVPHHPPGPHGAEGCRIGDRMDWLMAAHAALREKCETALAYIENGDFRNGVEFYGKDEGQTRASRFAEELRAALAPE